ncbi:hypothetical protein [Streptomyces sp. NPDC057910]|uniref:hypothetical protein n=1 Tax=Streptomyces sp. NPDC057910 TaxID=3346278 RepID=UPI0036E7008C
MAYHLPPYALDLNPLEGVWSVLRRTSQANTAFTDPDDLMRRLRLGLRQIQHRRDVTNGCLAAPASHSRHHAYNLSSCSCRLHFRQYRYKLLRSCATRGPKSNAGREI